MTWRFVSIHRHTVKVVGTYPKDRARVVLVVLQRYTAVPGTVGVDVGLHPVVREGVLAA